MALVDRIFRRGGAGPPEVDLPALQACLTAGVVWWVGRPPDPDLVRARLADGCRDAGLDPPTLEAVTAMVARLDDEGWQRLAVLTGALDVKDVRDALAVLTAAQPPGELLEIAFVVLARSASLLTLELLRQSPLRVEELARRFLARLGAAVRGESKSESCERLKRLDYERLLAEAERAKTAAADRLQELQRRQDEQEQMRSRRGKW
jgi:hypothetical protein